MTTCKLAPDAIVVRRRWLRDESKICEAWEIKRVEGRGSFIAIGGSDPVVGRRYVLVFAGGDRQEIEITKRDCDIPGGVTIYIDYRRLDA